MQLSTEIIALFLLHLCGCVCNYRDKMIAAYPAADQARCATQRRGAYCLARDHRCRQPAGLITLMIRGASGGDYVA